MFLSYISTRIVSAAQVDNEPLGKAYIIEEDVKQHLLEISKHMVSSTGWEDPAHQR